MQRCVWNLLTTRDAQTHAAHYLPNPHDVTIITPASLTGSLIRNHSRAISLCQRILKMRLLIL